MAKNIGIPNGVSVVGKVPKGWRVNRGATTAPRGYVWIDNGKSRFSAKRDYRHALIKESHLNRTSGTSGG